MLVQRQHHSFKHNVNPPFPEMCVNDRAECDRIVRRIEEISTQTTMQVIRPLNDCSMRAVASILMAKSARNGDIGVCRSLESHVDHSGFTTTPIVVRPSLSM